MSPHRTHHVNDTDRTADEGLGALLAHPVARRWLLKLCGSAAVGAAAGALRSGFGGLGATPDAAAAGSQPEQKRQGTLHFALGPLPGLAELTLHASGGERHALQPHTPGPAPGLRAAAVSGPRSTTAC